MSCYTLQDQGGCGCATPITTYLSITGCNNADLTPGATFSVVQDGTTVLTGVSYAGSAQRVDLPNNTQITVTVTASRFTTHTFAAFTPPAGGTTTLAMSPYVDTSTYACWVQGAYPLKKTLYATITNMPASVAMTYSGTQWLTTGADYSGGGAGGCAAQTAAINLTSNNTAGLLMTYKSTSGTAGDCPNTGAFNTSNVGWNGAGASTTLWTPSSAFSATRKSDASYAIFGTGGVSAVGTATITE